jgi:CelD/BcsL family acetyltransferase involved in cellulose biosynthesis
MLSQPVAAPTVSADDHLCVEIEPLPPLDRLGKMWRELESRSDARFFLSWTWIGTWLATVDCRPDLVIARLGCETVGLGLVQVRRKTRHRVMPVQTLHLHQSGMDDQDVITIEYNDFLLDRRCERRVRAACLQQLMDQGEIGGERVGEVVLGGLDESRRDQIAALGRPVHERAAAGSAFVDLAAIRRSHMSYLDTLKASTARRIRRALKHYRKRGDINLSVAATVDEGLGFFAEAGRLHQQRWTARGHPGAFAYPFYVDFHRKLIRSALPEGKAELVRVAVAGEPIGFLYNFLYRNRVYYYFSGFRFEEDNRLKPGLVCHALCIERHLADGMDVYDFMGGDQRYKLELGEPGPRIVTLVVQRPNWMLAAERPLRRLKQTIDNGRKR